METQVGDGLPTLVVPRGWIPAAFEVRLVCPQCWWVAPAGTPDGYLCAECYRRGVRTPLEPDGH